MRFTQQGSPANNPEFRRLLTMDETEYSAWLKARQAKLFKMRGLSADRRRQMRTGTNHGSDCQCHRPKAMHAKETVVSTSRALMLDKLQQARSLEARFANAKTGIHHPETLEKLKAALRPKAVE